MSMSYSRILFSTHLNFLTTVPRNQDSTLSEKIGIQSARGSQHFDLMGEKATVLLGGCTDLYTIWRGTYCVMAIETFIYLFFGMS